ncbi:hypothetical protein MNBD_BACTEROID07-21 [hydrothermal vent metagenome]|uniref:Uncharacterized protein n=1 Tax=hydrothermal vent metagenome TaxID=652676 RepID=A0A3B0VC77_9ZZZZ
MIEIYSRSNLSKQSRTLIQQIPSSGITFVSKITFRLSRLHSRTITLPRNDGWFCFGAFFFLVDARAGVSVLFQAFLFHISIWFRFATAEVLEEFHGVFGATFGQNIFAEACGSCFVKQAVFLECLKGIGVDNFGPDVAVIS